MDTVASAKVKVTPLCAHVRAEISGVKILELDDDSFAAVRDAFFRHTMLIFRNQHLGPDASYLQPQPSPKMSIRKYSVKHAEHPLPRARELDQSKTSVSFLLCEIRASPAGQ